MKRFICMLLGIFMLISLASCGAKSAGNKGGTSDSGNTAVSGQNGESAKDTDGGKGTDTSSPSGSADTLVVYFSATGSTKRVAEIIASELGADMFEITPSEPYTSADLNYNDKNSRVSREHDDPSLRATELSVTTPDGWEKYKTVYVGYPIWWGIAAWPTESFVKANDFSGKTVIPFCTSASSALGSSAELLAQSANGGDWHTGIRFSSGVSESEVVSRIADGALRAAPVGDSSGILRAAAASHKERNAVL